MKKYTLTASLLSTFFISSVFGQGLSGGSAITSIPVNARVAQACTITTVTGLNFSNYDPVNSNSVTPLNSTGQISIACTKGSTSVSVGLDYGKTSNGTQRSMVGTASAGTLLYNVFQPPSTTPGVACTFPGTIAWGPASSSSLTLATAPNSLIRLYSICGTIPSNQNVAADAYSDTITATINF